MIARVEQPLPGIVPDIWPFATHDDMRVLPGKLQFELGKIGQEMSQVRLGAPLQAGVLDAVEHGSSFLQVRA